jgi:hypothetical protein
MWFAALQEYHHHPWLVHLMVKIMKGDEKTWALLDTSSVRNRHFKGAGGSRRAQSIKAELWDYELLPPLGNCLHWACGDPVENGNSAEWTTGHVYRRKYKSHYIAPISLSDPNVNYFLRETGMVRHVG